MIGITGGIGSGKSYVSHLLQKRGVCVYDCDSAAARLMLHHRPLAEAINTLVGSTVICQEAIDKAALRQFLLSSPNHHAALNALVHPYVAKDLLSSGCQWFESAILFDSGFHRLVPLRAAVCVTAPLEVRIRRIMERNGTDRQQALQWIDRQWPQETVLTHCQYVICNDGSTDLNPQIDLILKQIEL